MKPHPVSNISDIDSDRASRNSRYRATGAPPRIALAKWLYWSRGDRPGMEDARLFGEPAWDMILDLYIHQAKGSPTSITAACAGSNAPTTTAMRYIDLLCELGWLEKVRDERDKRRSFLALTPYAVERMDKHLDRLLKRLLKMAAELFPVGQHDAVAVRQKHA